MNNLVKKQKNAADTEQKNIHSNAENKRLQYAESGLVEEAVYEVASCFAEDKIKQKVDHY